VGNIGSNILSFMGVISIVCLLVGMILLLHLIQQAFARGGVIWGIISTVYPPGTYLYCRRNWDKHRSRFMLVSGLISIALVLWLIVRSV
jgi:hypothetical protein